jgi:hypothetical protein
MIGVGVGFIGALWIVRWAVVRAISVTRVGWEGGRCVSGEASDRETFSVRTITKGRCGECRLSIHGWMMGEWMEMEVCTV